MSKSLQYGILVASTYLPKQKLEESAHFGIQKKQLSSTSAYNCPIHNFKIANNQQRFSLHVDKVHYKYAAVNSSFCKQAFLISPALPTPPLVWGMEASKESLSLAVSSVVRDQCKAKRQKPKAMFSQLVPAGDSNVSLFVGDKSEFLPTERPGGVPGEVSLLSTDVSSWIPMGNRDATAGRCQGGTWRSTC